VNATVLKTVLVFLTFLGYSSAFGQQAIELKLVKTIPVSNGFFTADRLGNIYWTENDRLIKYEIETGKSSFFSNPGFGKIHFIDATDPLNILVFHGDFKQVFWLDKNLIQKDLPAFPESLQMTPPELVCFSGMGGFWAYLPQISLLKRFNNAFSTQAQSLPLFEIIPGFNNPVFMAEAHGQLYVSQPDMGIAAFDAFGNLLFFSEKTGIDRFQVEGNRMLYFTSKELIIFDFFLQKETLFLLPVTEIKAGLVLGRRIYIQTEKQISVYEAAARL